MDCIAVVRALLDHVNAAKAGTLHCVFVDLKKAFDRVHRQGLWLTLERHGVPPKLLAVTRALHEGVAPERAAPAGVGVPRRGSGGGRPPLAPAPFAAAALPRAARAGVVADVPLLVGEAPLDLALRPLLLFHPRLLAALVGLVRRPAVIVLEVGHQALWRGGALGAGPATLPALHAALEVLFAAASGPRLRLPAAALRARGGGSGGPLAPGLLRGTGAGCGRPGGLRRARAGGAGVPIVPPVGCRTAAPRAGACGAAGVVFCEAA
eukprot:gene2506-biopygen12553